MRKIHVYNIISAVAALCIQSNYNLSTDIYSRIETCMNYEKSPVGQDVLNKILENASLAYDNQMPICQDTGMAVVFIEIGQEVCVIGGLLEDAINQGVRQGYEEGYLRKSVVADPLIRENTGDNTPAVIHYRIVSGDKIKITVAPKGFGSENMSAVKMLKPSDGRKGVIDFVVETVSAAGANPCPPIVVGVGIGGTMEKAAWLSKKALLRPINIHHLAEYYQSLEQILLEKINKLGIGPQGFGGSTTALGVNIETYPTHIAGLPVAVNINCHVTRHATVSV